MIPQEFFSRKRLILVADKALVPLIVVLVGASSFLLGRLSGLQESRGHLVIHPPEGAELIAQPTPAGPEFLGDATAQTASAAAAIQGPHNFVASKNGSMYYLPSCSGSKRISDGNKVWFATAQEAKDAGYAPAASCKGL